MKVNIKELQKIDRAIEGIDGWETNDIKAWETKSGEPMVTIRLRKEERTTKLTKRNLKQKGDTPTTGVSTTLVNEDKDYEELYPEE